MNKKEVIISLLEEHCLKNQFELYELYSKYGSELTWQFFPKDHRHELVYKIEKLAGGIIYYAFKDDCIKINTPLINVVIGGTTRLLEIDEFGNRIEKSDMNAIIRIRLYKNE